MRLSRIDNIPQSRRPTQSEMRSCPECGAPLPADAPPGLCPKCLMGADYSQSEVIRLCREGGHIAQAAFSPTGRYLATANGNGTVYILRLKSQ